jgi:hypothetical protein
MLSIAKASEVHLPADERCGIYHVITDQDGTVLIGVEVKSFISHRELMDTARVRNRSRPSLMERVITFLGEPIKNEPVFDVETPEQSWRTICAVAVSLLIACVTFVVLLLVVK